MSSTARAAGSLPGPPPDAALPVVADLFDADRRAVLVGAMAEQFATTRLRYLEYAPGAAIRALVRVEGANLVEVQVEQIRGETGPRLHRYPDDPALPALSWPTAELTARLGLSGRALERLAWVPGARAVFAAGDRVVKLHPDAAAARRAFDRAGRLVGVVPGARPLLLDEELAIVVSERVAGTVLDRGDAAARAGEATAVLARFSEIDARGLDALGPQELLVAADPVVALVRHLLPTAADRVHDLARRLRESHPVPAHRDVVHGDFNVGQLVARPDGVIAVVDVDTLALGTRVQDLAAYAANVVSGRAGDLADARVVAAALGLRVGGDGDDRWHFAAALLRRLDRAFRRAKRDWPTRTATMLDALERVVDGLGDE